MKLQSKLEKDAELVAAILQKSLHEHGIKIAKKVIDHSEIQHLISKLRQICRIPEDSSILPNEAIRDKSVFDLTIDIQRSVFEILFIKYAKSKRNPGANITTQKPQ
jgi:hypothetical protein